MDELYGLYVASPDEFRAPEYIDMPIGKLIGKFDSKEQAIELMNILVAVWDVFGPKYAAIPEVYVYHFNSGKVVA